MTIDCVINEVSIGGMNTSEGSDLSYNWTAANGTAINEANLPMTEVTLADSYTLEVLNTENGCTDTDQVIVNSGSICPQSKCE